MCSSDLKDPYSGISYYRLRQVDYDGNFNYSQSVAVHRTEDKAFDFVFATPDPGASSLTLGYYSTVEENLQVLLTDAFGNKIFSGAISSATGFNKNQLSIPGLSAAVYFVSLTGNTKSATRKIIIN